MNNYIARVIEHSDDGLTMTVEFVRPGYTPVKVGCLMPAEGVELKDHLPQYAPHGAWAWEDERSLPRDVPPIGTTILF